MGILREAGLDGKKELEGMGTKNLEKPLFFGILVVKPCTKASSLHVAHLKGC